MNNNDYNHDELHLHSDLELAGMESLLDELASQDQQAMSTDAEARILDSVSQVLAPSPLQISEAPEPISHSSTSSKWNFKIAAAALLATATTLSIVATQPWKNAQPVADTPNAGAWTVASFEEDYDAFLELESVGDGEIEEAVASWELWAQTIESDFESDSFSDEFGITDLGNGAL